MPSAPAAPEPASPFPFIGGRPCLNFVATLGKRHATPWSGSLTPTPSPAGSPRRA
ncbi:hypothetical protein O1M63_46935 [Streptomyces mirabilis]|nr:hypothetical protein [Streptomyces mirabilis]